MVGRDKERDWDREMAEVDKLLAKLPEADPTLGRGPRPGAGGGATTVPRAYGAGAGRGAGGSPVGTWIRVGLGVALGLGMLVWPYSHVCGVKEMFYLTGVGAVIVTGIWTSFSSWRQRLGFAHILSQLLIVWGLVLGAREVLPRVGYAKTGGTFFCPEPAPPTPNRRG